ncbi:MAG: type I restriction enzyme HsdR N-terminal domain-containing protein [Peptostreptococcaceae bacterium]
MKLTEEDTKARKITPAIQASGWKIEQIYFEHQFTDCKVIVNGKTEKRLKKKKVDYLLTNYSNFPIAIVEAKAEEHQIDTGIQQAIDYARILGVPFAYSSNGEGFLEHDMLKGTERHLTMS